MRRKLLFLVTSLIVLCVAEGVFGTSFPIIFVDSEGDSLAAGTYVLVAGGYTHELERNMQGTVLARGDDDDTVIVGTGQIVDVSPYESSWLVQSSGEKRFQPGHFVVLELPELDLADLVEKGRQAFDSGQYWRAEFFLSAALDRDSSQFIPEITPLAKKAQAEVKKELKRKLKKKEKKQEEKKTQSCLAMAHYYILKGNYAASEYYMKTLQRVYPKDRYVKETIKRIEGLRDFDAEEVGRQVLMSAGHSADNTTVEVYPEMIEYATPDYPRQARKMGIEGEVWVKALVIKTGMVVRAMVHKSSGDQTLDNAAVIAAYQNKFSPGIQKGRAINCWVSYKVNFEL